MSHAEPTVGIEPTTSDLQNQRSTTELRGRKDQKGPRADDETRTRNSQSGKLALYQLSYIRGSRRASGATRGGPGRARTADGLGVNQVLCQLSYESKQ